MNEVEKKDFIVWASKLQANYQPSEEVVKRLSSIELVALVGPTGVGKSTLIDKLGIPDVLSDVTRDPRPEEKDGKNYHFRNDYFNLLDEIKAGQFVQFLIGSNAEFYGTRATSYPESGRCSMAILASEIPHFQSLGFKKVSLLYVMPPSYIEWMRRIGGVRAKDLLSRIGEARDSLTRALNSDEYNFILNDTLELAVQDIQNVLNGNEIDEHRTILARGTAEILLERIGDEESEA